MYSPLLTAAQKKKVVVKSIEGEASGLKTNVQKSTVVPIHCLEEHRDLLQTQLPCQTSDFPCKYLGVPLSPHKLTKAQAHPIIDRIAARLPGWKADLLTKSGRSVLVQYVLTSMLIYLLLALDLPAGTLQAIDKIRRGFFMEGQKRCKGRALSNCMAQGHSTT